MGRRIRFRGVVLTGRVNLGISWEDKTGTETIYRDRVERLKVVAWFQTEELSLVWAYRTLVSPAWVHIYIVLTMQNGRKIKNVSTECRDQNNSTRLLSSMFARSEGFPFLPPACFWGNIDLEGQTDRQTDKRKVRSRLMQARREERKEVEAM